MYTCESCKRRGTIISKNNNDYVFCQTDLSLEEGTWYENPIEWFTWRRNTMPNTTLMVLYDSNFKHKGKYIPSDFNVSVIR